MRATAIKAAIKVAKARKHFSKKHGLRLNTPWLAPDLSLYDQVSSMVETVSVHA